MAFLEQTLAGKGGRVATPELIELEAKRADLIGKYKPDSERVKAIDSQIERLRKAIAGYDSFTAGSTGDGAGSDGRHRSGGRAGCPGGAAGPRGGARQGRRRVQEAGGVPRQPELRSRQARAAGEDGRGDVPLVRALCRAVAPHRTPSSRASCCGSASSRMRRCRSRPSRPRRAASCSSRSSAACLLSIGLGLARDHFDTTLKSSADVRRYANLETLVVAARPLLIADVLRALQALGRAVQPHAGSGLPLPQREAPRGDGGRPVRPRATVADSSR